MVKKTCLTPKEQSMHMISESNLIDLTRKKFETWESLNLDQLAEIFDEHGLMFDVDGKIENKSQLIEKMRKENCLLKEFNFQNTIARIYGTSAVVHGEGEFKFTIAGKLHSSNLNFLDVWIERENGWKLVSTHYNQSA